jgi:hypothetical protein
MLQLELSKITIAVFKADINKKIMIKGNILFHMITRSSTSPLTSSDSVAPIFELVILIEKLRPKSKPTSS